MLPWLEGFCTAWSYWQGCLTGYAVLLAVPGHIHRSGMDGNVLFDTLRTLRRGSHRVASPLARHIRCTLDKIDIEVAIAAIGNVDNHAVTPPICRTSAASNHDDTLAALLVVLPGSCCAKTCRIRDNAVFSAVANSALLAHADAGSARNTISVPWGKAASSDRIRCRSRRAKRWRITALPTVRPMIRPSRAAGELVTSRCQCRTRRGSWGFSTL